MKQKELIINGAHVALSEEQIKKIYNFFTTLAKEIGIKIDESTEETTVPAPFTLSRVYFDNWI